MLSKSKVEEEEFEKEEERGRTRGEDGRDGAELGEKGGVDETEAGVGTRGGYEGRVRGEGTRGLEKEEGNGRRRHASQGQGHDFGTNKTFL